MEIQIVSVKTSSTLFGPFFHSHLRCYLVPSTLKLFWSFVVITFSFPNTLNFQLPLPCLHSLNSIQFTLQLLKVLSFPLLSAHLFLFFFSCEMMPFISCTFTLVGVSGGSWDKSMCPTHCGEWKLLTLFFLGTNNRKFDKSEYFFRIFEQTMFFVHHSF